MLAAARPRLLKRCSRLLARLAPPAVSSAAIPSWITIRRKRQWDTRYILRLSTWNGLVTGINLLDTPGLPDLAGRAQATLAAVETVCVVISAVAGVESGTRCTMAAAKGKCRMIIVNKIDAAGVDYAALMDSIVADFWRECLPINLPEIGGGKGCR